MVIYYRWFEWWCDFLFFKIFLFNVFEKFVIMDIRVCFFFVIEFFDGCFFKELLKNMK